MKTEFEELCFDGPYWQMVPNSNIAHIIKAGLGYDLRHWVETTIFRIFGM